MKMSFSEQICENDYLNCLQKKPLYNSGGLSLHYEELSIEGLLDEEGIPLVYSLSRHPGWAKGMESSERFHKEMRMWLMGTFDFQDNFISGEGSPSAFPIITLGGKVLSQEGLSAFYLAAALGLKSVPIAFLKPINNLH